MRWFQAIGSVLAGFFGVQSEHNRNKDFATDSPIPFIISGLVMAGVLVLSLVLVVTWVIN
ncbi:DUF2970 domain-containing protein [Paraferrimonas haliotis]|uniref:DUF2970 domain-containing protein n=1 Tax=Paraferrimonas haliotis TaxID=2013866 RepID=UPI000BA9C769|nr:DUF2970 domain-containing protein [Paraferrimonas haliotis]